MPRYKMTRAVRLLALVVVTVIAFHFLSSGPRTTVNSSESETGASTGTADRWLSYLSGQQGANSAGFGLDYGSDGLTRGWDGIHDKLERASHVKRKEKAQLEKIAERHPIEELIERGRARWEGLIQR